MGETVKDKSIKDPFKSDNSPLGKGATAVIEKQFPQITAALREQAGKYPNEVRDIVDTLQRLTMFGAQENGRLENKSAAGHSMRHHSLFNGGSASLDWRIGIAKEAFTDLKEDVATARIKGAAITAELKELEKFATDPKGHDLIPAKAIADQKAHEAESYKGSMAKAMNEASMPITPSGTARIDAKVPPVPPQQDRGR